MDALLTHLEYYLGEIKDEHEVTFDHEDVTIHIAQFEPEGWDGVTVFATVGMSGFALPSEVDGAMVRHEFVMAVPRAQASGPWPELMADVCEQAHADNEPLLLGQVTGPDAPLCEGSKMVAVWAAPPTFLPDEFAYLDDVAIVWLVPIAPDEVRLIEDYGPEELEDELVRMGDEVDLIDVMRKPIF